MNDRLKIAVWAVIVLFIQVTSGPLLSLGGARPDFLLIYILLTALQQGRLAGLIAGFFSGLALDFLSLNVVGAHALLKSSLAFWLGFWLDERVGSVSIGWWMFILAGASLLQGFGISFIAGSGVEMTEYTLTVILPSTLYTCFIGLLWAIAPMGARSRGPLAPATTRGRRAIR